MLLIALISILSSFFVQASPIPDKLFGITLGAVYDNYENIPVKKFTGAEKSFRGTGIHYYFQPTKVNDFFEYIEKKESDNQFYKTSFRVLMLPIIPSEISSMEELNKANLKWEVTYICWDTAIEEISEKDRKKIIEENYYWAMDLCKTFSAEFSIKPKISNTSDISELKAYTCTFISGEKELKVEGLASVKSVSLGYKKEISSKKHDAVETTMRRLLAKEILP